MKSSGVEWIGEIPEEWDVTRSKNIFTQRSSRGNDVEEQLAATQQHGMYPQKLLEGVVQVKEDTDLQQFKTVHKNDYVISLRSFQGGFEMSDYEGVCSPAYQVFYNTIPISYRYYKYLFKSDGFISKMNSLTVGIREGKNIQYKDFSNSPIIIPPKSTQQRIASYLDKKCSKIEETIQNQQQVIEKLKAYKQSLITEAVTGKIKIQNEIPDFKYCNLGFIAEFKNGLNYNASDFGTEVKFLGVGDFQNYLALNDESMFSNIITDTEIEDDYYLKNGDIIFVRSNGSKELVGRAIMVDNIDFKVTYSGFCIRLRNKEPQKINSKFLLYFFRSDHFRNELQRLSQGSNISNINQDLLSHIKIPLVEMRFQESVIDFLNKKCTAIDTAIEQKQNLIEKLTEYKKSLIYECVTGKKEI